LLVDRFSVSTNTVAFEYWKTPAKIFGLQHSVAISLLQAPERL
jgi:hypothetical protein